MSISESFAGWLQSNAAIGAITDEIRPQVLPDDASYPALTYQLAGQTNERGIGDFHSMKQADFIVNFYSPQYADCKSLATVARSELEGFVGIMGDYDCEQVEIDVDFDRYMNQEKLHGVSMTATIWYTPGD